MEEFDSTLALDFESYCDESVTDIGADAYSRHPTLEILMAAYTIDDGPIQQWIPAEGQPMPDDLHAALTNPRCLKFAWNKSFEWSIIENHLHIHTEHREWRDPMVLGYTLSFPGKLEKVGPIVGLPMDKRKDARGKALIRKFCGLQKPNKTHLKPWRIWPHMAPKEWEEFLGYNVQDVVAERAIWRRIRKYDMPPHEWENWFMDQEINQAGIPVNVRMVNNAIRVYDDLLEDRFNQMRRITGMTNPNSTKVLLPWMKERGYPYDDCQKGHVKRALEFFDNPPKSWSAKKQERYAQQIDLQRVLELRLESAKSSPKKYATLRRHMDVDAGVLRNAFQFAGAGRTWRWCLAEGSLVLVMRKDGVIEELPIQEVTTEMFVWDGAQWVAHEGVVFSGIKEVVEWDGVTATKEHKVFVSESESMTLGEAKEKGMRLWGGEDVFDL
ncbi:MAG: hypothetical protein PHS57_10410 [Alphaproteobacteria bacterium]|nr:hypothetical protein [Alphaproteobacteria bacterium]